MRNFLLIILLIGSVLCLSDHSYYSIHASFTTIHAIKLYFGSNRVYAQGIKFMDDVKGKIDCKKQRIIKGFDTEGIVGIVNKLPIINQPVGYDAVESEAAFQDGQTPAHVSITRCCCI